MEKTTALETLIDTRKKKRENFFTEIQNLCESFDACDGLGVKDIHVIHL